MPRKPEFNRDDLIGRARDLFWQRGWAGTSLKDLERVLKMNPGSFYAAFGSKDALFGLAMDRYAKDGRERLRNLAEDSGPLTALQQFPQLVIGSADAPAKACMLAKTVLELQTRGHPLADQANQHLRAMEDRFADLFRQAQQLGEISSDHDPAILARRYQSDLMGLRISAERGDIDASAIADEIAESLSRLG
ncbi:TetR/AcrR family transcriptional regulator [Aliishimia ponticola]|uniref:TetR/AcrR family transcriptional regulator n=1 Tax=Aliishimia ponticola TaxID=2499833 RepID=A0A4V3XJX9_9RHOB|nr:TetR/AcrR family transcriptional regulator [Aliishimia ponticola]THH34833.1 TetR/AcrR family transcriptional regulator [Aliishimia ponticola]